ncbi:MAG: hypothetical protein JSW38_13815 [Dehalococcoidia bacterium]|nr:MAG: hypothetical protein JSV02_07125 [Dehalococcoidia bacterium]UCG83217.1 MAG: hypothetical protein JSW38_13815 [Dehalococcoidia bacterium]
MEAKTAGYQKVTQPKVESELYSREVLSMKRCAEKIWNAISKYVVFDNDAIFKDPNWPYLWDKKKE